MKVSLIVTIVVVILLIAVLCLLFKKHILKGGHKTAYMNKPFQMSVNEGIIDRVTDMLINGSNQIYGNSGNNEIAYIRGLQRLQALQVPIATTELDAYKFGKACQKAIVQAHGSTYALVAAVESYVALNSKGANIEYVNVVGPRDDSFEFVVRLYRPLHKDEDKLLRVYTGRKDGRRWHEKERQDEIKYASALFSEIRLFKNRPFFPQIDYSSTDFDHAGDGVHCFWMITPVYKSAGFATCSQLKHLYVEFLIDTLNTINNAGYVQFEWNADTIAYEKGRFILINMGMQRIENVKYRPNVYISSWTLRDEENWKHDKELPEFIDKVHVLKEIHDITEAKSEHEYRTLRSRQIECEDLLDYFAVSDNKAKPSPVELELIVYHKKQPFEALLKWITEKCRALLLINPFESKANEPSAKREPTW